MPLFRYSPESDPNITLFWPVPPPAGAESQPHRVTNAAAMSTSDNTTGDMSSSSFPLETFKSKYDSLSASLKSCLDYCSMLCTMSVDKTWAHNKMVGRERLVQLLVAEGLIRENHGDTIEDTAQNMVDQLIRLGFLKKPDCYNFLAVADRFDRVCLVDGEKEDFDARSSVDSLLHVFIQLYSDNVAAVPPYLRNIPVQSLFLTSSFLISEECLKTVFGLRSLLVLDLHFHGGIVCLPHEVGDLVKLKYFRLMSRNVPGLEVTKFPWTFGTLIKLRTWELGSSDELPEEVLNIKTLRHLLIYKPNWHKIKFPRGIGRLVNLRTCLGVHAGGGIADELSTLTQIRHLSVSDVSEDHANDLLEAIMKMRNLISLSLDSDHVLFGGKTHTVLPLLEPFSPPPFLQDLYLRGTLMEMPNWIVSMQNLSKLSLFRTDLSKDDVSILQFLPTLKLLYLWDAYKPKLICKDFCTVGGFPKLETLLILAPLLEGWIEIVNGAFPNLRILGFCDCENLKFLPDGLQDISTLEELNFFNSNQDLARRLRGVENYKIKQVSKFLLYD